MDASKSKRVVKIHLDLIESACPMCHLRSTYDICFIYQKTLYCELVWLNVSIASYCTDDDHISVFDILVH